MGIPAPPRLALLASVFLIVSVWCPAPTGARDAPAVLQRLLEFDFANDTHALAHPRSTIIADTTVAVFNSVITEWRLPPKPTTGEHALIHRVLVLFHGCFHSGSGWFTYPEEVVAVRAALHAGFVVLAFSAKNRCWTHMSPPQDNAEALAIQAAYTEAIAAIRKQAESLGWGWSPSQKLYGIGASSGGTFISLLPSLLPFTSIAIYISPGHPTAVAHDGAASLCHVNSLKTVLFVYMPRDVQWATTAAVSASAATLTSCDKRVKVFPVHPRPVTLSLLKARVEECARIPALASGILTALETAGHVDQAGELVTDPRAIKLEAVIGPVLAGAGGDTHTRGVLRELDAVLRTCYAYHAFSSEHMVDVLAALAN